MQEIDGLYTTYFLCDPIFSNSRFLSPFFFFRRQEAKINPLLILQFFLPQEWREGVTKNHPGERIERGGEAMESK